MRLITSLIIIATFFLSCSNTKPKFDNVSVSDLVTNKGGYDFATINYCLKEEITSSNYEVLVEAVSLDGQTFNGFDHIPHNNGLKEKCFTFQTNSSGFVRHSATEELHREVSKIYKRNLKSLKLTIHERDSEEILDEIQINSFN